MPSPPISRNAHAHGRISRAVVGGLRALGLASLPALLGMVVYATDPPVTPPVLLRLLVTWTLLPLGLASLLERLLVTEVGSDGTTLVIARRDVRVEIPLHAIDGVVPWRVPLPRPGFWLRMRSGRRLGYGLAADDPSALLATVGHTTPAHPTIAWAQARAAVPPRRWYHRVASFGLFALLPAGVLFNAHQHIAYGGTFGQWYLLGAGAWWTTLAVYWGTMVVYLVLYAATWRWLAELAALAAAPVAPSQAARVRRTVELVCGIAYWAGVPLLLALRFLP